MLMQIQIISLILLLILSAFFSGVETALMSINLIKIKTLLKQKKKGADALYRIKKNPYRLIVTILIGNNLVNIGAASLATWLFTDLFGNAGVGVATGVMTLLILVFGEITPKTVSSQNAVSISLFVARPIELLSKAMGPIVSFFEWISRGIASLLGTKKQKTISQDELKTVVNMGFKEGILDREIAEIINNVLEFEGTKVTEIMTPKINMKIVDGEKRIKDILDYVVKTPYSRFPVYYKERNKIIGILDLDDVLRYVKNKKMDVQVKKIVRTALFVPETKEIDNMLTEFEGMNLPMALVVDEYGYVSGLITIEDILEEIVGDIFDKSKKKKSIYIKQVRKDMLHVDGRASVDEINKELHLGIEEDRFSTIAGYIEHMLQRIPKKGEKITLNKVTIEVDKVTNQGILSVKIFT